MPGHFDDCAEHLRPQLIMFLSVDVVGSTAFKQKFQNYGARSDADEREWFSVIQGFYIRTVQSFLTRWAGACADPKFVSSCGAAPLLWKTIGDEIVFRKAIGDYRQVAKTLHCWRAAMAEVRDFLQQCDPQLDVKCTAWMGEFPVQNKIVIAPTHQVAQELDASDLQTAGRILSERLGNPDAAAIQLDFIGPAIDIGFRLASRSSARKFVVSIDVAFLLALDVNGRIELFYNGMECLKGVLGGLEYPIFWIDMTSGESIDRAEDKLIAREACDRDDLLAFCGRFYAARSNYAVRPFIVGDASETLDELPGWYRDQHRRVVAQYS